MASVEVNQMLAAAAAACEDKKAEDIRILALDPAESGLSDYFLICTGTNDRQTVAITDEIELRLKREFGTYPNSVEGRRQGEWILMDYVDFIVHVFLPEKRAFYGLERLRKSATTLSVEELDAAITTAIEAKRPKRTPKAAAPATDADAPAAEKTPPKRAARKVATAADPKPTRRATAKKTAAKKTAGAAKKAATAKKRAATKTLARAGAKTATRARSPRS